MKLLIEMIRSTISAFLWFLGAFLITFVIPFVFMQIGIIEWIISLFGYELVFTELIPTILMYMGVWICIFIILVGIYIDAYSRC